MVAFLVSGVIRVDKVHSRPVRRSASTCSVRTSPPSLRGIWVLVLWRFWNFLFIARWNCNSSDIIQPKRLGLKLELRNFDQFLRHRLALLLLESLVLQIELHVVDPVERLLRGLAFPNIRDEIANNIDHSLISDFSLASQLLPQSLLNLSQLHFVMVISLLEGSSRV